MRLNLFEDKSNIDEHVDLYFKEMNPVVRQIIDTVNAERPVLYGRAADEDLDDGDIVLLDPKEIYYMDFVERRLFAYTKDGVFRVKSSLASCEEQLWNYGFVRVSKSNLINIYKIKQLKPDLNMRVFALFDNGERICINRNYRKKFHEYLIRMKGIVAD
ncbi:MAG: LytTR family transcriptional regulator DNA-binding domain-containing protein [Lachnospiraceae bacterium]|nr:LytTR family transcriptional regulator DNA-binding domain-containing protein [Lachnospiraceae bacterium]